MTGNDRHGLVLQERDYRLFRELAVMRVTDREQIKRIVGFGSITRANSRLLALTEAGFLRRFFLGTAAGGQKAVYSLSRNAAQLIDVPYRGLRRTRDELLIADFFVAHQLAVNEIYCVVKARPIPVPDTKFLRWLSFNEPLQQDIRLIPDGYFEILTPTKVLAAFLEVDLGSESHSVLKGKVETYLRYALSEQFFRQFHQPQFRVLVVTTSDRRMHALRASVAKITQKVFWFSTLKSINGASFWSSVWLRPKDNQQQSLL